MLVDIWINFKFKDARYIDRECGLHSEMDTEVVVALSETIQPTDPQSDRRFELHAPAVRERDAFLGLPTKRFPELVKGIFY